MNKKYVEKKNISYSKLTHKIARPITQLNNKNKCKSVMLRITPINKYLYIVLINERIARINSETLHRSK